MKAIINCQILETKTKNDIMVAKKLKFTLFLFFVLGLSITSFGWGRVGHHIIVEIAKNYVSKDVQDSINKYLGDMTWDAASTWMDELRGNTQYDYMKQWHYINIDKGGQYDTTIENGNNVVKQLEVAIHNLKNRSKLTKEEINLNIKVLFHLMGDIHQPLHVGYGNDRGGNSIKVTFEGKQLNLHRVWDTDIIEYKKLSTEVIEGMIDKTSHRRIRKIVRGNPVLWLNQSRENLDVVYSYTEVISEDYINKSTPIIENLLMDGGLRLGKVLNEIFKG